MKRIMFYLLLACGAQAHAESFLQCHSYQGYVTQELDLVPNAADAGYRYFAKKHDGNTGADYQSSGEIYYGVHEGIYLNRRVALTATANGYQLRDLLDGTVLDFGSINCRGSLQ